MDKDDGANVKLLPELIGQMQKGEASAYATFWEDCFGPVHSICRGILGDSPVAVDTTADLLTDFIFTYVHNLTNPSGAWAYVKLMAIRRSVRERQRMMSKDMFDEQKADVNPAEGSHQEERILLPRLEECLSTLTPKAQAALRLKYKKDLSNEKIGEVVGGTKQYIGRLLQKSIELLRSCLALAEVIHE